VDLFGAHCDVVDDGPVARVEVIDHLLVAFVQVSAFQQPADVALHGADVAFGVVGDGPGGRVGAAAVFVGVVGVAEKDQLADAVAAAHRQAEHERAGFDTHRSHPRRRQLASNGHGLVMPLAGADEGGESAPVGGGQLYWVPVLVGDADGGEQAVVFAVVPVLA
jgi:hypothetical protein